GGGVLSDQHRFTPRRSFRDHLPTCVPFDDGSYSLPDHFMIVGNHDSHRLHLITGNLTLTTVLPGADSIASSPPKRRARSCMPGIPTPCWMTSRGSPWPGRAIPQPLSSISRINVSFSTRAWISTSGLPEWRYTFDRDSCTMRKKASSKSGAN